MRRRFRDEVDTEQLHDAVGDVDEELLLPPLRTPMVTYDPAEIAGVRIEKHEPDLQPPPTDKSWLEVEHIADARNLIRGLANPWLWLITLTLWGVLIGAGWLLWQVVT